MRHHTRLAALAVLGLTVLGLTPAATATAAPPPGGPAHVNDGNNDFSHHGHQRVCTDKPGRDQGSCGAIIDTSVAGPLAVGAVTPSGYSPGDLAAAYNLPTGAGAGRTIAIVDAFDLPTAQNDLNTYRAQYGLPPCGPGCFTKVNQNGGATLPPTDTGWGQEIALDMDMAAAACPNCRILLVEASSTSLDDFGAAVNTAVRLGAVAVSNSYGGTDGSSDNYFDSNYFNHPGVAITASSGDSGFGVQYPASSPYVTAVGGTSLTRSPNARGFSESAWSGAGSGCSAFEPKPSWQRDGGCGGRTVADVSAVSDPATGVAVYNSTPNNGQSGWLVFGGTSAAAPLVAGAYALAGPAGSYGPGASSLYANRGALNDVATGSNGACGNYLCNGVPGYDGPTGLGSPNGVGAFTTGQSPIAAHYAALGGAGSFLGNPVSGEYSVAGGRELDYQGGSIYYSPATGAFSVRGAIRDHYNAFGGPAGFLGFPTTDESGTPDGVGRYNHFANDGSIYYTPNTGAQSVHGAIRDQWAAMGFERSSLGYPTSDETPTPNRVGSYNYFTGGSLYYSPATGAHEVRGAILNEWGSLGWEASVLGFPTSGETPTPNRVGSYNYFTGGSIYYSPATGAHEVHGAILNAWAAQGWEAGSLGFPATDEYAVPGGRANSFRGGTLTYSYSSGRVTRS